MELSEAVVKGLKVAGSSLLSDQLFRSLLSRVVDVSSTSSDEGNVCQLIYVNYTVHPPHTPPPPPQPYVPLWVFQCKVDCHQLYWQIRWRI